MALIKCPECGKEISDKSSICIGCGFPVKEWIKENKKFFCLNCGEEIKEGVRFCPECGNAIGKKKKEDKKPKELPLEEQPELFNCHACGRPLPVGINKCIYCGAFFFYEKEEDFVESPFENEKNEIHGSVYKINGIKFDIEEVKNGLIFQSVSNITRKVRKLCKCEQEKAEEVVYGYFLSMHGEDVENKENLRNKIRDIKSWNRKELYCPYCLGRNIDIRENFSESITKGKSEVRKKSAVTRAGNKAGRAGMIMMTGGLWALTPKKSEYNEVSKGKTTYQKTVTKTCMDCGAKIK